MVNTKNLNIILNLTYLSEYNRLLIFSSPEHEVLMVSFVISLPRRLFCFGSLVILDVARCYLWLFTLYINIKISKNSC